MKLKIVIILLYGTGMFATSAWVAAARINQEQSKVIVLDRSGTRGVVPFDHKKHEARITPDANAAHKAAPGAACIGCHHTSNQRGIPQLWKCAACHRGEGDPANPKNRDFDEVWSERAFHDSCIGCHRASTKGPTTCGGCHKRQL
jgi:hypothetical protein